MAEQRYIPQWILPQSLTLLNQYLREITADIEAVDVKAVKETIKETIIKEIETIGGVKYAQTIIVAKSGGDYTDPRDAVDYANSLATSEYSRYLIFCLYGVYDFESNFLSQTNPYITVMGIDRKGVVFTSSNLNQTILTADGCHFVNLKVNNSSTYALSDNFNDDNLDTNIWTYYNTDSQTKVIEQNQRLEMNHSSVVGVYTNETFEDFDVSVKGYNITEDFWLSWGDSAWFLGTNYGSWGYRDNTGQWKSDWDTTPPTYANNTWFTLRLVKSGTSVKYYINTTLVKTVNNGSGIYSFYLGNVGQAYFDDFAVIDTGAYSIRASDGDTVYLHNVQLEVPADPLVNFKEYELQVNLPVKDGITIDNVDISVFKTTSDTHIAMTTAPIHGSTSVATANKLVHRDASGRAKVAAPSATDDIAQKAQADAVQTDLDTHKTTTTGIHGVAASTIESVAGSQSKVDTHAALTATHGATGAVVGTTNTQSLTNKTLDNSNAITVKDANLTVQDDLDTTKQAKLQASGITTATTRTITLQDADITMESTAGSQSKVNTHADLVTAHASATNLEKTANKDAISGYAGLNASQKVIKDPANATATPTASKIPIADATGKLDAWVTGGGSGDVVGPASAVDSDVVEFDGTTGKLVKDGTLTHANVADAITKKHTAPTYDSDLKCIVFEI